MPLPRAFPPMHYRYFRELLRDTDIAYAIQPIIRKAGLSFAATRDALVSLDVPRAEGIAKIVTNPKAHREHAATSHI